MEEEILRREIGMLRARVDNHDVVFAGINAVISRLFVAADDHTKALDDIRSLLGEWIGVAPSHKN